MYLKFVMIILIIKKKKHKTVHSNSHDYLRLRDIEATRLFTTISCHTTFHFHAAHVSGWWTCPWCPCLDLFFCSTVKAKLIYSNCTASFSPFTVLENTIVLPTLLYLFIIQKKTSVKKLCKCIKH